MSFPHARRIRGATLPYQAISTGDTMLIEQRTKRRWIVSVLDAAADETEPRARNRAARRQAADQAQMSGGQKGYALHLQVAARQLRDAAR